MSEKKKFSLDADLEKCGDNVSNEQPTEKVDIPQSCWLDVTEDIVEPKWLLKHNGIGFSPLGDIQVLRGMEGNGKSFLFTILMAAVLKGEYGTLSCEIPDAKVLYVDTEQHKSNTLRVQRRVHRICGWKGKEANPRFKVMLLREVEDLESRQKYLWQAIDEFQPTAVFVDGVADLVSNINDYKECMEFVHKMMAEASKRGISLWSILHVNYGSDKMRGHLGTEIAHKTSDVMSCQKDKTQDPPVFTVEQVKARNKDIRNFQFVISDDETRLGIPMITTFVDLNADTPTNRGERDELMKEIFGNEKLMTKSDIIKGIINKRFIANDDNSRAKAKDWFNQASDWGIIDQNGNNRKWFYVGLNADPLGPPLDTQTELDF